MSKKSSASLSIVPPAQAGRMNPPEDMNADQAELWRQIMDSKPAGWFDEGSAPLLAEFVRAVDMANRLENLIADQTDRGAGQDVLGALLRGRDMERKAIATLGTKLRLTQQSRYTPQAANTANNRAQGRRPWEPAS